MGRRHTPRKPGHGAENVRTYRKRRLRECAGRRQRPEAALSISPLNGAAGDCGGRGWLWEKLRVFAFCLAEVVRSSRPGGRPLTALLARPVSERRDVEARGKLERAIAVVQTHVSCTGRSPLAFRRAVVAASAMKNRSAHPGGCRRGGPAPPRVARRRSSGWRRPGTGTRPAPGLQREC